MERWSWRPVSCLVSFVIGAKRPCCKQDGGGMTDSQLLERFLSRRDEAAFAALVRRHGPMVLGVCRRVLGHAHDAEAAFQATFLVLVRKAHAIAQRERLVNWLYGTAYPAALEAKAIRRRLKEKQVSTMPEPSTVDDSKVWCDLQPGSRPGNCTACRGSTGKPSSCAIWKARRGVRRPGTWAFRRES